MYEITMASLLVLTSVILFMHGLKQIKERDIQLDRFKPYVFSEQEYLQQERQKKKGKQEQLMTVDLKREQKIILTAIGVVSFIVIAYSVTGQLIISLIFGIAGVMLPKLWVVWQISGQWIQIERQFEQAAEQMAVVLRAGGGLPAAIERAALEAKQPIKGELERMLLEIRAGVPIDEVFKRASERIKIPEIEALAMVTSLQKSGMAVNVPAILDRIQESIRERRAFKEQVKAITAEGRLSATIVGIVPFATIGLMRQMVPEYVSSLFNTPEGIIVFILATAMIITGTFWIRNMIDVEI
ncbi:MAG: type II secretion system F family protein [Thermovenabulum sp.]|uniref:type II secretion system F family protein n=1 Tax=Thermovenabulum sp. TaxID=3100335 RepID=UPI003C7AB2D0